MVDDDRMQGDWNSAQAYLMRIDEGLKVCNEGKITKDANLWGSALSVVFIELSTKMKVDEFDTRVVELRDLISLTSVVNRRGGIEKNLYWRLYYFECFLRRVYFEAGLEMKMKADASRILFKGGV